MKGGICYTFVEQIKNQKTMKTAPEKYLFQLTKEEFDSLFRGMLNDIIPGLVKEGIKEHLKGINVDQPEQIDHHFFWRRF